MSRDFQMQFRHSEGNLHIRTSGKLDVDAARGLLKLFVSEYRHGGRIFVDTAGLEDIHPAVRGLLDSGLPESSVAPSSLYFKGEKGFQIAPAGCRVIVMARDGKEKRKTGTPRGRRFSRHVCCGKCAHCTCHGQGHGEGGHCD